MEKFQIIVEEGAQNTRIDKFIAMHRADSSRSQIQQQIKNGLILVNGEQTKANYRVNEKDVITIEEFAEEKLVAENLHLNIIYEDEDLLIVNKRRGMVIHPAKAHATGTLVNGLLYHTSNLSSVNGDIRPGIVHRLDKDTSGLLVVAKNDQAHASLVEQLVNRTVKREYIALVHGHIPHSKGKIEAPIGRDEIYRQKMTVTDRGKEAVTHFEVLEQFQAYTLVKCQLETGRTHQIRVHMNYIGHPIVGDERYGLEQTIAFGGQVLHAETLGFVHPTTGEYVQFTAEAPEDFQQLLEKIRNAVDK